MRDQYTPEHTECQLPLKTPQLRTIYLLYTRAIGKGYIGAVAVAGFEPATNSL